jgi:hypothetical protein
VVPQIAPRKRLLQRKLAAVARRANFALALASLERAYLHINTTPPRASSPVLDD